MNYAMQGVAEDDVRKWRDALDLISVCTGFVLPNNGVPEALELARQCRHPDAQWLCSLFPDNVSNVDGEALCCVMEEQGHDDARALFLSASWRGRPDAMQRAADLGFAPAQAAIAAEASESEAFHLAQKAAKSGDRAGIGALGDCLLCGRGCTTDVAGGIALLTAAARLGDSRAQCSLGEYAYEVSDWQRFYWWGQAVAQRSTRAHFAVDAAANWCLKEFCEGRGSSRAVFEIGSALHSSWFTTLPGSGREHGVSQQRCVDLFGKWCNEARKGIWCWSAVGRRLGVSKDIRQLIARLLWEERREWSALRVV
jgi:hypothetical protein